MRFILFFLLIPFLAASQSSDLVSVTQGGTQLYISLNKTVTVVPQSGGSRVIYDNTNIFNISEPLSYIRDTSCNLFLYGHVGSGSEILINKKFVDRVVKSSNKATVLMYNGARYDLLESYVVMTSQLTTSSGCGGDGGDTLWEDNGGGINPAGGKDVGIGNVNPIAPLDVTGNSSIGARIRNSDEIGVMEFGFDNKGGKLILRDSNGVSVVQITNDGASFIDGGTLGLGQYSSSGNYQADSLGKVGQDFILGLATDGTVIQVHKDSVGVDNADGFTIIGDGSVGNEFKVDTTEIATPYDIVVSEAATQGILDDSTAILRIDLANQVADGFTILGDGITVPFEVDTTEVATQYDLTQVVGVTNLSEGAGVTKDTIYSSTGTAAIIDRSVKDTIPVFNNAVQKATLYKNPLDSLWYAYDEAVSAGQIIAFDYTVTSIDSIYKIKCRNNSRIRNKVTGAEWRTQQDSIAGFETDGIAVVLLASGNYAVIQPDKNGYNLNHLGAISGDGLSDNGAFEIAKDISVATGLKAITADEGSYFDLTSQFTFDVSNMRISGDFTVYRSSSASAQNIFESTEDSTHIEGITFQSVNDKVDLSNPAILSSNIRGVVAQNTVGNGNYMTIKDCTFNNMSNGVKVVNSREFKIDNCNFYDCATSMLLDKDTLYSVTGGVSDRGFYPNAVTLVHHIYTISPINSYVSEFTFIKGGGKSINILNEGGGLGAKSFTVKDCRFESTNDIFISGAESVSFDDCTWYNAPALQIVQANAVTFNNPTWTNPDSTFKYFVQTSGADSTTITVNGGTITGATRIATSFAPNATFNGTAFIDYFDLKTNAHLFLQKGATGFRNRLFLNNCTFRTNKVQPTAHNILRPERSAEAYATNCLFSNQNGSVYTSWAFADLTATLVFDNCKIDEGYSNFIWTASSFDESFYVKPNCLKITGNGIMTSPTDVSTTKTVSYQTRGESVIAIQNDDVLTISSGDIKRVNGHQLTVINSSGSGSVLVHTQGAELINGANSYRVTANATFRMNGTSVSVVSNIHDFFKIGTTTAIETDSSLAIDNSLFVNMPDNLADASKFSEGATDYQKFVTTNGSEKVEYGVDVEINGILSADSIVAHRGQMNFTDSIYTITITGIDPITNDGNNLFSSHDETGNVVIDGDSLVVGTGWVEVAGFVSLSGTAVYKVGLEINGTPVDNYGAHTAVNGDTRTWPIHYSYHNASGNDVIKPTIEVISGGDTTPELGGGSITVKVE